MTLPDQAPFEKHYRIGELARIWGLGQRQQHVARHCTLEVAYFVKLLILKYGGEGGIRTPGRVFDPTTV